MVLFLNPQDNVTMVSHSTTVHSILPLSFPLLSALPQLLCDIQRSK